MIKSLTFGKVTAILATIVLCANLTVRAEEKETELGNKMKIIGKSVKALKTQIADATKQQSSIELLEAAKTAAVAARTLTPDKAKDVPEADRPKFVSDFQAEIDKLIAEIGKIEDAVRAGKYDDAGKLYDELGPIKREAHKQFQAEKE
jgi:soluble cytochrome b562